MLKKRYLFLIFIICILAVSAVSAADNVTDDNIGVNEDSDNLISSEVNNNDIKLNDFNLTSENLNDSDEVLYSTENQDVLSYNGDGDVLGASPPHSAYSVSVSDTTIDYSSGGYIYMYISPSYSYSYAYDFYLRVYDSNDNVVINKNYYSSSYTTQISHSIGANQFSTGTYKIELVNYYDGYVMDTANLYVVSVPYTAYSVDVSDKTIDCGSSGYIVMSISPASSSYYNKYDFYLKVYDSNDNEVISQRYYSTSSDYSESYYIYSNDLDPGNYTIRIINSYDDYVMDSANLYVVSVPYTAYSVDVSDTTINYGSSGSIYMSISPAGSSYYNRYDFYLKVYDSEGNQKISQRYYGTSSDYSKTYNIGSTNLNPGKYTIRIINCYDNVLMDSANLYVVSVPYTAYSVDVSDTSFNYRYSGSIYMSISPANSSYNYRYDFYLKVYDSEGNQKISQRYYGTSSDYSKSYYISSYELGPGKYTIRIINCYDNVLMDSANLYVVSVPYTAYSVDVSDTIINYGSGGSIYMPISPANSSYYYRYDFYLKVYDSKDNEVISQGYYGTSSDYSKSYYISSYELDSGKYTIRIINCYDNVLMDIANLYVVSVPYTAYSVDVSDKTIDYGSSGSIYMSISPASSSYYYRYDFYLKVYDLKDNEVISQRYYSTSSTYSQSYYISSNKLNYGNYTIRIINSHDHYVMDTANLYVVSVPYTAYSVDVSDTSINSESSGSIYMSISPASYSYYNKYDFYLKVYDSKDNEVISQRYYSTSSDYYKYYYISSSDLDSGKYKIRIINSYDDYVMDTANLDIVSVPYSAYSVDVSDKTINYGYSGYIDMSISPASSSYYYRYDFYLKVYDSKDNEVISQRYYSTSSDYSESYYIYSNSLNPGKYTIKIINNYDNHVMDTAKLYIRNSKNLQLYSEDYYVGDSVNIEYYIVSGATGTLSVYIDDSFIKNVSVDNNKKINLGKMASGVYKIKVVYKSNNYYNNFEDSTTFEVHRFTPTLMLSVNNITVNNYDSFETNIVAGSNVILQFMFDEDINGKINVKHESDFDNNTNTLTLVNGKAKLSISKILGDYHLFTITYGGNSKYLPFNLECGLIFKRKTPSINYEIPNNLLWGDTFIINPVLPKDATGKINITVKDNNEYYFNDIMKIKDKYYFTILNGGKNYLQLDYLGDGYYDPCTYVGEFNVAKLNTTFSIPDNIEAGRPATINVTLNEDATGIVRLRLNSNNYLGISVNGSAVFNIPDLPYGIYNDVSINYDGDSKYNAFNKLETINVTLKKPVLTLDIKNIVVGNDVTVIPKISEGATGNIEIYVDDYYKSQISVGYSYVLQEPAVGKHEVKLVYSGDNYFQSCENKTSFWVFAAYPIEAEDTYIIHNTSNYFKAKFYDLNHNVLSNKYVVFNVGGKDYARLTDNNGWSTLDIGLDIGIYNVTSINAIYNEKTTNKLVVFSSIQSENLTRAYNSSADFNATFLDDKAKPLSNTPIIFKVNGSDYSVTTNMYGQAVLNEGLDVGTYEIISINPTTGENKTNSLTIVPSIQAKNMLRAYNSSMDFKATFIGANSDPLVNTTVTFEIGSRPYNAITDEKGIAILNVPLAVGKYSVTAVNPVTHERLTKKLTIVERIVNNTDIVTFTNSKDYFRVVVIGDNAAVCGSNEIVVFTLNNKNYSVKTDKYGYASLSIPSLNEGAYQINTTYKGFTVSNSIKVFKELKSIISIDVDDANYTEDVCLNVGVLPKYMHGNLTIRILNNNKVLFEFNTSADKAFSKKLKGLNASDYLVTVNFTDMDKYYTSNDFSIFKVLKINPKIIVVADAVDFNQDAKITINIPNVKGNVTFSVGDKLYTEHIPKNGVIVKTISKLNSGKYPINVKFEGNNNYNPLNATAVLNVNKLSTTLKLSYVNNTYNSVTLTAIVNPSSAGGNVVFTVNGKDYTVKISGGKATYKLSDLSVGSYNVNAVYKGDVNHKTSTSNSIKFTVPKRHVNIAASDVTKNYGGSEKLVITLTNPDSKAVSNAEIKVSLAGKNYTLTTGANGKASLDLNLNTGNYIANIVFAGNSEYLSESTSAKVTIKQLASNIVLSYTKNSYNSVTLTAKVDPATAGGNVVFNVNGSEYVAKISKGKATYTLSNLDFGFYNAKATYKGDVNHKASSSSSINFHVYERYVVITAPDVTKNYGGSEKLEITLTNQDSKAVGNAEIKVSLAGKNYTLTSDKNGKASLGLDLNSGTYIADIIFVGNSEYLPESTSVKVIINQLITNVSLSYIKDTYNSVTLTAAVNPSSAGGNVVFTVNGKDYKVKLGGGKATLKLSDLAIDSYTVKAVYGGDVNHKASTSNSIKFTVSEHYVNIAASDVVKYYGGSEKLEIALINQDLKGVGNAEIRVSLDGTVYTLTTDKNGKASLALGLDSGIYDAYIVFVGNEEYKSETKIVKVTINRLITNIVLSYIMDTKNSVTLTATVNPSSAIGNVVFTVNDHDYEVKLSGGKATLKLTDLAPASYDAEATYAGDTNYRLSISNTIIFTVEEPKYYVSAPDLTKYYHGSQRFVVTVKDKQNKPIVNGNVIITLNNVPYKRTTDANGQASMAINLNSGVYHVTSEFDDIKVQSTITVKPTISGNNVIKIYRNATQYYAAFTDSNGNLLKNTDVNFNINGVFYTRKTNDYGVAKMNINLLPGEYIITATNPISTEQYSNVIKVLPSIITYDLTKFYKNASKLTFMLLDNQGRPVGAGVSATININGVFYTRQTNASGYVNMNINLNPGTYIATLEYNGLKASSTVKVLPILVAKDVVMKYRDGTKFEVKLLDGQGRPFANRTIKFNINGVMYNRITDGSGIARLNLNLMAGEYIITSMYENGAAISNKVTIRS